jgi:hypothetical protein
LCSKAMNGRLLGFISSAQCRRRRSGSSAVAVAVIWPLRLGGEEGERDVTRVE